MNTNTHLIILHATERQSSPEKGVCELGLTYNLCITTE